MRISPLILGLAFVISTGCDSDSGTVLVSTPPSAEESVNSQETLVAMFAGATFVSTDALEVGQNANGSVALGNWFVSFTADTVSWAHADVVEIGTYEYSADTGSELVAKFSDRDVSFQADGGNLIWDSLSYRRAAASQFDSWESMVNYFDGARYNTVEQFDIGENAAGELVMGNWSLQFTGNEISWWVQDYVSVGSYSYINGSSFKASFFNRDFTVILLDNDQLIINSVIYEKDFSNQFNSQETLVAFLSGSSYKSVGLRDIGETSSGTIALGNWHVDFLDDTFTWAYQDVAEVGTFSYLDGDSFTALLADREYTIEVEGDDIVWDNVRYTKVTGQ